MTKEEIIAKIGKTGCAVEMIDEQFDIARSVFYAPIQRNGIHNQAQPTCIVAYYNSAGEQVGEALLNIHIFQKSYIRLSEMKIQGKEYDVMEDCSAGKEVHYIMTEKCQYSEVREDRHALYDLLRRSYRILYELEDGCPFEAVVNPSVYEWFAERYLTE